MIISFKNVHKHSSLHKEEILTSEQCGCFCCLSFFHPTEIIEWVDEDQTAMCPKCQIDSVIGSSYMPLSIELLSKMKEHFFNRSNELKK